MGPAGFIVPDDAVIAERMQRGLRRGAAGGGEERRQGPGWIDLSRGLARETVRRRTAAARPGQRRDHQPGLLAALPARDGRGAA